MSKRATFIAGQALPSWFPNSLQEFIGSMLANITIVKTAATTIKVAAGTGAAQATVGFGSGWRYVSADVTATHPGGAAGTYDVYATASADNFTGVAPNVDITTYSFALQILAVGSTPGTALYRKIGTVTWDGTAITAVSTLGQSSLTGTEDLFLINTQTGTTYTLVLADRSKLVELSNAAAITLTVPPNSSVAYPVGTVITLLQVGAGQVTVAPGAGVTINASPGLKLAGQWAAAQLIKRGTDTWVLAGNLVP